MLKSVGAWLLFLSPYSPDLNPNKMAFARLKTLIRKAAARSYDEVWKAAGTICDIYSSDECEHYFRAAEHVTN